MKKLSAFAAAIKRIWLFARRELGRLTISVILGVLVIAYIDPRLTMQLILTSLLLLADGIGLMDLDDSSSLGLEGRSVAPIDFLQILALLFLLIVAIRFLISVVPRWIPRLKNAGLATAAYLDSLLGEETGVHPSGTDTPASPQQAAATLRARSRQLRRSGRLMLASIVLLLLLGFLMFQGAEGGLIGLYKIFESPLDFRAQVLRNEIDYLTGQISSAKQRPSEEQAQGQESSNAETKLARKQEDLKGVEARLAELAPARALPVFLVSTLGTKIAAVIFLIFLVQILGNLYRYVTRLAYFTDSRADFLELLSSSESLDAPTLAEILGPEKLVELDRMPAFPLPEQFKSIFKGWKGGT